MRPKVKVKAVRQKGTPNLHRPFCQIFSDIVVYILVLATAEDQLEALKGLPPGVRHAIKKVDFDAKTGRIVRLELHAKDPSLKSLQSIFGMDRQRLEVPGLNGEAIPISVAREIIEAAYRVTA